MKNRNILLILALTALLPMAVACVRPGPDPEPEPEPVDPALQDEQEIREILRKLHGTGLYDIGDHTCFVETSSDRYSYPDSLPYVPPEIIVPMSTLGLMETILSYPWPKWTKIIGADLLSSYLVDPPPHMESYMVCPDGLREFYGRDDAASLVERYTNMYVTCAENNYSSEAYMYVYPMLIDSISMPFFEIQVLMSTDTIIGKMTREELRATSIHVVKTMMTTIEEYADYTHTYLSFYEEMILTTAGWLAVRILETEGYEPFRFLWGERHEDVRYFMQKLSSTMSQRKDIARLAYCFNNFIRERL